MATKCDWIGASGTSYTYDIHQLLVSFNDDQLGNYIYSKLNANNRWVPIYIGEGDLGDRISDSHQQALCIEDKGATHVHVHLNSSKEATTAEEEDLLARYTNAYKPTGCNVKRGG